MIYAITETEEQVTQVLQSIVYLNHLCMTIISVTNPQHNYGLKVLAHLLRFK